MWRFVHGASEGPFASYWCTELAPGATNSFYVGCSRGYDYYSIWRVSENGDLLWTRLLGSGGTLNSLVGVAPDANGGVIFVGDGSGGNATVSRFDSQGTLLNQFTYTGQATGIDADAMAVDAQGNIYLAGTALIPDRASDGVLAKFSASGELLWERFFGGPGAFTQDALRAVAVTESSVVAAGYTYGNTLEGERALAVQLTSSGQVQWQDEVQFASGLPASFQTLAVANDGTVLAAGSIGVALNDADALIVRYASDGAKLAQNVLSGGGAPSLDLASEVRFGPDGNAVVAGYDAIANGNYRVLLARLSASGELLQRESWVHPSMGGSRANALVLDHQGNAYVAGGSWAVGTREDIFALRFNAPAVVFDSSFE